VCDRARAEGYVQRALGHRDVIDIARFAADVQMRAFVPKFAA
jgi:hypothetical protein